MEVLFAVSIQNQIQGKVTKEGLIGIIQSVGGQVPDAEIDAVLNSLGERNVDECIAEGNEKMASMQVSAPVQAEQVKEEVKEAPKEQEKKEEDVDLFGDIF